MDSPRSVWPTHHRNAKKKVRFRNVSSKMGMKVDLELGLDQKSTKGERDHDFLKSPLWAYLQEWKWRKELKEVILCSHKIM